MLFSSIEKKLFEQKICFAGVDEAGRGPLAGPVVAAAVILPHDADLGCVNDSKKLSAVQREEAFEKIIFCAHVGVGVASVEEIDRLNIVGATMKAMHRAIEEVGMDVAHLLIDGKYFRSAVYSSYTTRVKGDATELSIAAASIIAKVTRDRMMCELDKEFPHYGFAKHKGYGTRAHYDALKLYGPASVHRKSFLSSFNQYVLETESGTK